MPVLTVNSRQPRRRRGSLVVARYLGIVAPSFSSRLIRSRFSLPFCPLDYPPRVLSF